MVAFLVSFAGCSGGSNPAINPISLNNPTTADANGVRSVDLVTRTPIGGPQTIDPAADAWNYAINGLPASAITYGTSTVTGKLWAAAEGPTQDYVAIWNPTARSTGGAYELYETLYSSKSTNTGMCHHLYSQAYADFCDDQGYMPAATPQAAAAVAAGAQPLDSEAPGIPSCATNGTCNAQGADVTAWTSFGYSPFEESTTQIGFVGFYGSVPNPTAYSGVSVPNMTQECATKAAELKTAQKNYLLAEAALVAGAIGLAAVDFSSVGVLSVGAVAGVVILANQVKTAQESLQEAKEEYAEAKC